MGGSLFGGVWVTEGCEQEIAGWRWSGGWMVGTQDDQSRQDCDSCFGDEDEGSGQS